MAITLLLVSSSGSLVQSTHVHPTAIESMPYKQALTIPIDTSQDNTAYQPIDIRITFTSPCWAINETLHSIRVGVDDGTGLQEIESQIYDLQHSDETHITACSLVFLIPQGANGKEKYYVVYDSKETSAANYPQRVALEDTHYFYEPIPGQTIDFDYYGIKQDGYVVYAVVQKGQLLGNPIALAAIKFKPNSTSVETYNLDQVGNFDFRYGVNGDIEYVGTAWATDITKTVLVDGNLMVRVRLACTAPRGDVKSDNIYTYYYSPTDAKRIMVDARHDILKPITIEDPTVIDGNYAAIVSIKARSASIEKMNVGDILPSVYVYTNDNTIQEFSVPTNPQSTTRELVLSPQDDINLGAKAWVYISDSASGKVHGMIFSSTTGITNGSEDGVQVKLYAKQNIKLPGLEADTGNLILTRKTYDNGNHLTTIEQGKTYQYKTEFLTVEKAEDQRIDEESTIYQRLIKDVPVHRGNATQGQANTQRYNLTAFVHLARSVPLGSLLSAALGKNMSYIYAELYQAESFRSSGTVGRLSLGSISLNMTGKTLREKIHMALGIFDWKNASVFKKIRFPTLDPGTYVVKIFRENPRFAKERQFIGVAVVNLTTNTAIHILCRLQGSVAVTLRDQENNGVQNARCILQLANTTITEVMTDADGTARLAAPCYPLKPYHLAVQYQGFQVGEEQVRLNALRRFIAVKASFSLERYSLLLTVTDAWGLPPAVDLNPTLESSDMVAATLVRGEANPAGAYRFSDLPPASYRLSLGYKSFKLQDNLTVGKDTSLDVTFPGEFPLNVSVFDSFADRLTGGEVSFQRNGKTESASIREDGTATLSLPAGDYEIRVRANDETVARQQVQVRGEKNIDIVTEQGSFFHTVLGILGVALVIGTLVIMLWKRRLTSGLKVIAVGVLIVALGSPWWVLHGETSMVSTTTNTLVVPPQIVTLTTSSNATGGEISAVPKEVTMVLGLLSLLVAVACILLLVSVVTSLRLRKTTMLVSILSIVVLLLILIVFYYAFSQVTQVGVGSFMGSGTLDVSLPGGTEQLKVPCTWGPGLGLYLVILSLVLAIFAFFGKRIEGRVSKMKKEGRSEATEERA